MSTYPRLEPFKEMVYYCFKCGMCRFESYEGLTDENPALFSIVCPAWDQWKLEAYTAIGRNEICRGLLEGKVALNEKTIEIIFACTLCGACKEQCSIAKRTKHIEKFGGATLPYDPLEIAMSLRRQAVEASIGPLPDHKRFGESVKVNKNPYLAPHTERFNWLKNNKPQKRKAKIVYFVGCTASYRQQPIAESTIEIFNKIGVDYTFIDEQCCGSPLLMTGQYELAKEVIQHNVEEMRSVGAEIVVTSCAGCYRALKGLYPEIIGGKLPFEVLHATQFFNEQLQKGKLPLKKPLNISVTYHDPCHIGRHMGIFEEPRTILENLPGVKLIEMERIRNYSYCCGAGAGFKAAFPEQAVAIASTRVREAEETEANFLTTACPFCRRNLSDGAKNVNSKLLVCNIEELICKTM